MLPQTFETSRLVFSPLSSDDAPLIFAAFAQDFEVARYMTWRPHRSIADTESFVSFALSCASRTYLLRDKIDARLHGTFELRKPAPHRLGFGYLLARASWGAGLMTEALSAVVAWGANQPDIWRISETCDVDNVGSARVMEKAGLTREALLRRWAKHPNISDDPRDCYSFAWTR